MTLDKKGFIAFSTGFESTSYKIGLGQSVRCADLPPTATTEHGCYRDVLESTNHDRFFREDLELISQMGISVIRYPVPWHKIEAIEGEYEWTWMDQVLAEIRRLGITIIADPLHHTSFPSWLNGFSDPKFSSTYINFVRSFAQRYPWVKFYTIFNEPTPTILFCSHDKVWHPFGEGPDQYVPMLRNVAKTMCLVAQMLKELNQDLEIVHVDTCEHHQSLDDQSRDFVRFLNERRFLVLDLILGNVASDYCLWWYLEKYGFTEEDIEWFAQHRMHIDYLGLDYYCHSEHQYHSQGSNIPSLSPRGFAEVAKDYWGHFKGIPLMLTETNIRGYVSDRISWLKHMLEQTNNLLADGVDIRLFCWFPFIDSTDWDRWVTVPQGNVDPVGLYWLDRERITRHGSELTLLYRQLNLQTFDTSNIPAYLFQNPLDLQLRGFISKFMGHWNWKQP